MLTVGNKIFICAGTNTRIDLDQINCIWETMLRSTGEKILDINNAIASEEGQQLQEALQQAIDNSNRQSARFKEVLKNWLMAPESEVEDNLRPKQTSFNGLHQCYNQQYPQQKHTHRKYPHCKYNCWYEVALALNGWAYSNNCRQYEKKLARENYQNLYLDSLINCLIYKLYSKLMVTIEKKDSLNYPLTMELLSGQTLIRECYTLQGLQSATDFGYYRIALNDRFKSSKAVANRVEDNTPMAILKAPQKYCLKDKIVLFHDMAEYLGDHQPWNPQTAGQWLIDSESEDDAKVTTNIIAGRMIRDNSAADSKASRKRNRQLRGIGLNHSSRDESALSSLIARKYKLSLWGGHSMSVVRMLNTARWAYANKYEFTALAQGLIAFWQLDFDKNHPCSPSSKLTYHTLHETMDMAKNFGVSYDLSESLPGSINLKIDHIDSDFLAKHVHQTAQVIQSMLIELQQALPADNTMVYDSISLVNSDLIDKKREAKYLLEIIEKQLYRESQSDQHTQTTRGKNITQTKSAPFADPDMAEISQLQLTLQKLMEIEQSVRLLQQQFFQEDLSRK